MSDIVLVALFASVLMWILALGVLLYEKRKKRTA